MVKATNIVAGENDYITDESTVAVTAMDDDNNTVLLGQIDSDDNKHDGDVWLYTPSDNERDVRLYTPGDNEGGMQCVVYGVRLCKPGDNEGSLSYGVV